MVYDPRHDSFHSFVSQAFSLHGVCFSRAGLSIGHDGPIEAVQNVGKYRFPDMLKHPFLSRVNVKHMVEHEADRFILQPFYYELFVFRNPVQFGSSLLL